MEGDLEIRRLGPADDSAVFDAAALFDRPPMAAATARFLASNNHHLLVAYLRNSPAGFVSGVERRHPDKGVEMFLNELGVSPGVRRRGIGRALVAALAELAGERGCSGMWVLTDLDDAAALSTYRRSGAGAPKTQALLKWRFEGEIAARRASRSAPR